LAFRVGEEIKASSAPGADPLPIAAPKADAEAVESEITPTEKQLISMLANIDDRTLDDESHAQFSRLRTSALDFALQVMALPLDPQSRHFPKILSAKQAMTASVLTAMVRVRPGDLRDKDDDGVAALLRHVKAAASEAEDPIVQVPTDVVVKAYDQIDRIADLCAENPKVAAMVNAEATRPLTADEMLS
jgi:hypothetical protein